MSDDTPLKRNNEDSNFTYQPIRFSHEEEQWLEMMTELNSLLAEVVQAFRIPPELIGETTNYSAGTSREEVYRKRLNNGH